MWGDTVNLAGRLQTLAGPDTIRVTARVAEPAIGQFEFEDWASVK